MPDRKGTRETIYDDESSWYGTFQDTPQSLRAKRVEEKDDDESMYESWKSLGFLNWFLLGLTALSFAPLGFLVALMGFYVLPLKIVQLCLWCYIGARAGGLMGRRGASRFWMLLFFIALVSTTRLWTITIAPLRFHTRQPPSILTPFGRNTFAADDRTYDPANICPMELTSSYRGGLTTVSMPLRLTNICTILR